MPNASGRIKFPVVVLAGAAVAVLSLSSCSFFTKTIEVPGSPEGFELTQPQTTLAMGEPAYVATEPGSETEGEDHAIGFWKITPHGFTEKSLEEVGDAVEDAAGIGHFVCTTWEYEFLGWQADTTEEKQQFFHQPSLQPVNNANFSEFLLGPQDEHAACGVPAEDTLPSVFGEPSPVKPETGRIYQDAYLSPVAEQRGREPQKITFSYRLASVPDLEFGAIAIEWKEEVE